MIRRKLERQSAAHFSRSASLLGIYHTCFADAM
jgi:hypothetical protein